MKSVVEMIVHSHMKDNGEFFSIKLFIFPLSATQVQSKVGTNTIFTLRMGRQT